jgi:hypothetical protein
MTVLAQKHLLLRSGLASLLLRLTLMRSEPNENEMRARSELIAANAALSMLQGKVAAKDQRMAQLITALRECRAIINGPQSSDQMDKLRMAINNGLRERV